MNAADAMFDALVKHGYTPTDELGWVQREPAGPVDDRDIQHAYARPGRPYVVVWDMVDYACWCDTNGSDDVMAGGGDRDGDTLASLLDYLRS